MARILVVTNLYPPHHYGGYELSCHDVVTRWADRGHDVAVLTSDHRVPGVDDPDDGAVHRALSLYWDDHRIRRPSWAGRVATERRNQRALAERLRAGPPDVVSCWNLGAVSLGVLATVLERGLPTVLVVCDDWLLYAPDVDAWHRAFRGRPRRARAATGLTGLPTTLPPAGDAVAACYVSRFTRDRAEREARWAPGRSGVVYSGVERRAFPAGPGGGGEERPWRWRLLHAGRLDARKGVSTVVRAVARLPAEATLELLGRGDERVRADVDRLAAELGVADRVTVGEVPRPALAGRYAEADVVVVASEWDEPFGLVPLEAMACGTPVVATGTGGSGEYLVDGANCVRFAAGDPDALAGAVRRLAGDPALRRRVVEGGRQTAARYDTDALADILEAWHLAAIERFAGGQPPDRAP